ncbi:MAG: AAA family ATPase [Anaerolineales bacterium]
MLTELRIQNFAIIDELKLKLASGFIVFTGETGAGKSIIIDAVEMLLGGRADSTMVRSGAEHALLEGDFSLEPAIRQEVHAILEREELLDDPDHVTIGREIRAQGRNICRINGRTVNLGLLRELGELLVDVHGQSAGCCPESGPTQLPDQRNRFRRIADRRGRNAARGTHPPCKCGTTCLFRGESARAAG